MSSLDQGRFECKYALPLSRRDEVLEIARDFIQPDPNGEDLGEGRSGYLVHSLYYDTPQLSDYYARLAERKIRDRLRARTYGRPGEGAPVFLENKRKLDDRVIKGRVRICDAEAWNDAPWPNPWAPFVPEIQGAKAWAARDFVRLVEGRRRPVSIVHYRRAVYIDLRLEQPKVRLTMDWEITATVAPDHHDLYAPPDVDLIPPDWMVMELKFDGFRPAWMRQICRRLALRAVPVSKFGLSVARGLRARTRGRTWGREIRYLTPRPIRAIGWGLAA